MLAGILRPNAAEQGGRGAICRRIWFRPRRPRPDPPRVPGLHGGVLHGLETTESPCQRSTDHVLVVTAPFLEDCSIAAVLAAANGAASQGQRGLGQLSLIPEASARGIRNGQILTSLDHIRRH